MLKIPIFQNQSADFSEQILIEGIALNLRFAWNTKSQYWMLNEYKEIETGFTLNGIKLVLNYPILHQFSISLKGQFIIFLQDSSLTSNITYQSLGDGHNLFYLTNKEFLEWKVTNGFQ